MFSLLHVDDLKFYEVYIAAGLFGLHGCHILVIYPDQNCPLFQKISHYRGSEIKVL